jgi:hypothetical protein
MNCGGVFPEFSFDTDRDGQEIEPIRIQIEPGQVTVDKAARNNAEPFPAVALLITPN